MVETAYINKLDKTISEKTFIKLYKRNNSIFEYLLTCPSCGIQLTPIGKNKILSGIEPKHLGFMIKNRIYPHDLSCKYVTDEEFSKNVSKSVDSIKEELSQKNKTIVLTNKKEKQTKSKENSDSIESPQNNKQNTLKNSSNKHLGKISRRINISNLATLVGLFMDKNIRDNINIKTHLNLDGVHGTNEFRRLSEDDLFLNMDCSNIEENKFFIFFGTISFEDFKDTGLLLKFKNNVSVPTNKKKLKETTVGRKILRCYKKEEKPVIYFEGYIKSEYGKLKAKKVSRIYADDIYMY